MTQPAPRPRGSSPATRDIVVGATVYGADNVRFGQIAGSYRNFLIVERGFFMPVDYYVPMSAIGRVDGDLVVLSVSRDAALTQGWERPPFTSETGQPGLRRPAVGRPETVVPGRPAAAGSRAAPPSANLAAAAASWPAPPRTGETPMPVEETGAVANTSSTGAGVPGTTGQADAGSAEVLPTVPDSRPAAIPATGAFADTYAVGTNTESYHAMSGFPDDPITPLPDQPAPEVNLPAPMVSEAEPAATPTAEPEDAAAEPATGEDVASARVSDATSDSGPNQLIPADAVAPSPGERPAP